MVELKVLIVDDEAGAGKYLKRIIEVLPGVTVVAVADNSREALAQFDVQQPQVVFLDIDMPDMSGMELANLMIQRQANIYIIFATAYPDYALQAFELYSFDYIVKPFNQKRIIKTMRKLQERINTPELPQKTSARLKIDIEGRKYLLNIADILYIESRKPKRVLIKTIHNAYIIRNDLNKLEQKLRKEGFFRCHRSYLVNLKHMKHVHCLGHTFEIILDSDEKIMLSRQQEKKLREELGDVESILPYYKIS